MRDTIPRPDSGDPACTAGHVPALDGVRGIAILAVLCVHMFPSDSHTFSLGMRLLVAVRNQMWIGVVLFFALSGFLITGILYDTLGSQNYFRTFFGRRTLRIFPLYYGALGVLLLLTYPFHLDWGGQAYQLLTYTPNIPYIRNWDYNPSAYINLVHFWSLAVEEQFYLLWPLLVFWLRSWRKIFIATLAGSLLALSFRTYLAMTGSWPANHTLPACMDSLLMGGSLAMLVRTKYRERILPWGLPLFMVALATMFLGGFIYQYDFIWEKNLYLTTVGMTVLSLGMTGLIAATLRIGSLSQRLFARPVLRFFGRYSYGLYVYHYSLFETARIFLRPVLVAHGLPKTAVVLTLGFVSAAASTVLAVLSYELYEKHFLKLKRYFPYRKKVRPAQAAALKPQQ